MNRAPNAIITVLLYIRSVIGVLSMRHDEKFPHPLRPPAALNVGLYPKGSICLLTQECVISFGAGRDVNVTMRARKRPRRR